jgi:hypothetical protein
VAGAQLDPSSVLSERHYVERLAAREEVRSAQGPRLIGQRMRPSASGSVSMQPDVTAGFSEHDPHRMIQVCGPDESFV